jgi:bleomycin hydrolase
MKYFLILFFIACSHLLHAQSASEASLPHIRLTDSVQCTEVKDQSNSPTCWAFGTNSLFESDLIKQYNLRFNLSEMFIARHAYIDKAKQWLATKGKTYYAGGGQFHDVIRVIKNHGMVPEEAYTGRANGEYLHDHADLDTAMKRLNASFLQQGKATLSDSDLKQMNDTLDRYLGKLPETFWYDMIPYTPKTYAAKFLNAGDDYIELMSFSDLPFDKKCLLSDKFNWAGDSIYNITLDDMQMLVDTALANGWSVGWEGDVTNPGFNFLKGFAMLDDSLHSYAEERLLNYKTEKTERDHMLHLIATGRDENNKKWYYLKNSWGTWFSKFKGYLYMNETYFKMNTVILMVNKLALPKKLKEKLN